MIALLAAVVAGAACNDAPSGVDERICYGRLADETEREMEVQVQATLLSLRKIDQKSRAANEKNRAPMTESLVAAQATWRKYRSDQCEMIANQWSGGTGYGEIYSTCTIQLDQQRIDELKKLSTLHLIPPWP